MSLEPRQTSKIECLTKKVKRFKPLTIFSKQSILGVLHGSGYAFGSLKLLCRDLRGIYRKADICQTDYSIHSKQRMFPHSNVIHGSTTFKLTKS